MGCCVQQPERQAEIPDWAAEVRRYDLDSWLPTLFVPDDKRPAFWALAAFNLELLRVPDAAGETMPARIRFQWWRETVLSDEAAFVPLVGALKEAIARFRLDRDALDRLIEAHEFELDAPPPADGRDLADRAERLAAPTVLAGLKVLGGDGADAFEAGRLVGRAMGVTRGVVRGPFEAGTVADALRDANDALARARGLRSLVPRFARPALLGGVAAGLRLKALARAPVAAYPAAAGASRLARVVNATWAAALGRY